MLIVDWIHQAEAALREAGIESSRLEAQVLVAHSLGIDRSALLARTGEVGPGADGTLARRLTGEPLAYILGYREFYGRRFFVNSSVLIPRQETETVVEAFFKLLPDRSPLKVLDLGAGSGVLGITLKLERPELDVTASDVSAAALEVAWTNKTALGADVTFIESDGFENLGAFDLIASNPPYVADSDELPREVSEFEPHRALFSGPTGLEFYERLAIEAGNHVVPKGTMILELGFGQHDQVREVFERRGWSHSGTFRDLAGVQRVITIRHP